MRQIIFSLIAFLFSTTIYSQNIEGKWQSKEDKRMGLIFHNNGSMDLIDLEKPDVKVLQNITLKYEIKNIENSSYLEVDYFVGEIKNGSEKWKFRIENNLLYIDKTDTTEDDITQSVTTKKEEIYIRIN